MARDPTRRRDRLVAAGLALLSCVVFADAVDHRFTLDARFFLIEDGRVRGADLASIWSTDYWHHGVQEGRAALSAGLYRPLTLTALSLLRAATPEEELAEDRSAPIVLAQLVLHGLKVALAYLLFLWWLRGRSRARALAALGALVTGLHPVSSEAVATHVGLSEGLSAALALGALLVFTRWLDSGGRGRLAVFGGLLLLALLAKESAVVVVVAAPLSAWLGAERGLRGTLAAAVPGLAVAAAWLAWRFAVLGSLGAVGDPVFAGFPYGARLASSLAVIAEYDVPALVWPLHLLPLTTFQDLAPAEGLGDPRALAGLGLVLLFCALVVVTARRDRAACFGLLFFGAGLLPASNLVVPIGALAATRFLYLPLVGLALAAACGLGALWRRRTWWSRGAASAVAAWLTLGMAVLSVRETAVWRDMERLYRAATERSATAFTLMNLGEVVRQRAAEARAAGRESAAGEGMREALKACRRAVELPLPRIPGSDRVPEDVLDVTFNAAMNGSALSFTEERDPEAAKRFVDVAVDVARRGLRQGRAGVGTTDWRVHLSDALSRMGHFHLLEALGTQDPERRRRLTEDASGWLDEAERVWPENVTVRLRRLERFAIAGDGQTYLRRFRALYEDVRDRVAESDRCFRIAFEYADRLQRVGRADDALAVRLRTLAAAPGRVGDPRELFRWGMEGAASRRGDVRALAVPILRRFLEEAAVRHPKLARAARRRLAALGRGGR